jgi:hypothetical protein
MWPVGATYKEVAAHRLADGFLKKNIDEVEPQADERALQKFLESNRGCGVWKDLPMSYMDEVLLGTFKSVMHRFWYTDGESPLVLGWEQIFCSSKHGPGAAVGIGWESAYAKLSAGPMTTTSSFLYDTYRRCLASDPTLNAAELLRADNHGTAQVVKGGRLGFVPKKRDISRTTEIQPSLNMYLQQGLGAILENRLKQFFGINLKDQQLKNRELARLGSLTDGLVTLDLSEASNSVSLEMCRAYLPRSFTYYLEQLRCEQILLPRTDPKGPDVWEPLSMLSTMGNGFTFPLETAIFAGIVVAAYHVYSGASPVTWDGAHSSSVCPAACDFGVFGDDIICSRKVVRGVLRLLDLLGFKVNSSKSFVEGPFRESCGADWYLGKEVRPVYTKSLATLQDRYALVNALNRWTAKTGIPLSRTVHCLLDSVPRHAVPRWESDDAGLHLPLSFVISPKRSRQYHGSFLYYGWRPVINQVKLANDGKVTLVLGGTHRSTDRQEVIRLVKKMKVFGLPSYNPFGLLHCALGGMLEGSSSGPLMYDGLGDSPSGGSAKFAVRQLHGCTYALKPLVAPSWDSPDGPAIKQSSGINALSWDSAVHLNMVL